MSLDFVLREQLLALLDGSWAHNTFEEVVSDLPIEHINLQPPGMPFTPWRLLEHLRISQWDILEFVRNPEHGSPLWPEGYWPPEGEQAGPTMWAASVQAFRTDLQALRNIVADPATDFFAPIPHAPDYTIFREILLAADHNAYHTGEFGLLRHAIASSEQ